MSYIGKPPAEHFTSFATQTFSVSATTSYTLDHGVANENEIALFVNNVRQQPGSGKAYTATGTALTLSAATATTDTMYCIFLGRALQTVTPATNSITAAMVSANAVTGAKLNTDVISAQTALGAEPADTDEFLVSDAGVLKRVDYSYIKGGGITEVDHWRVTANTNANTNGYVTSNWERNDTTGFSKIGTGLSESSGVFSFPSTGIYIINFFAQFQMHGSDTTIQFKLYTTVNNSSYTLQSIAYAGNGVNTDSVKGCASNFFIFDVTDTSNCKFKLYTDDMNGSTSLLIGDSSWTGSGFNTIRLGDT